MRLREVAVVVLVVTCLHSVSGHKGTKPRAAGRQGRLSRPFLSGSRNFRRTPKSQNSPWRGLSFSRNGVAFAFPFTNGSSMPWSSLMCEEVMCPQGMVCRMENRQCNTTDLPCGVPLCFMDGPLMTASSADNDGVCPMSAVDTSSGCVGESVLSCTNDITCDINQKCCVQGCSVECTNVTSMARALIRATVAQFTRSRGQSSQSSQKSSQGTQTPSSRSARMDLFCPSVPDSAFANGCGEAKSCKADGECEGNSKCCLSPCGKMCLNPVSIVALATEQDMKAAKAMRSKAASVNASAPAVLPLASKRGVCPSIADSVDTTGLVACSVDSDCTGTMKCCAHGTGFGCYDPITFMKMPSSLMSTRMMNNFNKGSAHELMRARGACPNAGTEQGLACGTQCEEDSNCTDSQLCCSVGASCKECVNPVISSAFVNTRPGMCPSFSPDLVTTCQVECNMDSDCLVDDMKCCSMGCAQRCANPVPDPRPMVRAGTCPEVTPASDTAQASPGVRRSGFSRTRGRFSFRLRGNDPNGCGIRRFSNCRLDSNCPSDMKCCMNDCEAMRCMMTV